MFSGSNNRHDYQLFFRTRGAFRPLGWNGLIAIVCILDVWVLLVLQKKIVMAAVVVYAMIILLALGQNISPEFQPLCNPFRRAISLWSPLAAILLLTPTMQHHSRELVWNTTGGRLTPKITAEINFIPSRFTVAKWTAFFILLVVVLMVTISRLRFPIVTKLADSALCRKLLVWGQTIQNMCMLAALVMLVLTTDGSFRFVTILSLLGITLMVSSGNFQIPAAVVRAEIASFVLHRLIMPHNGYIEHGENPDSKTNLVPSLIIFYGMVMAQGILYIVACILDIFSFIPRRSLIRRAGLRGQLGVEYVNLYAYAFEKCMGGAVFVPKKISLTNFAINSLNSDSPKNHFYGIQLMHSLLENEMTRVRILDKLITSTKTIDRIIMQLVSALLDTNGKLKKGNPLLQVDDEQEERQDPILNTANSQEERPDGIRNSDDDPTQRQEPLEGTDNLPETQTCSTHIHEQNCILRRRWQHISEYWKVPKEHSLTYYDHLPALGMLIIDKLASCGQNNCVEIDRRLTSIGGEIGITLRYKILKHPFLLRNLAEILGDNNNNQELRKHVAGILRNLAIDGDTRKKIGHMQVLITRLMKAFLNSDRTSSTNVDCLLTKVAGQALAMLATDNVHNCLVMLKEPDFINKLKRMIQIHDEKYIYVAATLLCCMCQHAQAKLTESDLKELSQTLREVLERIMNAEGAELEILIGLSSQICKVIPEEFSQELDDKQIKQRFIKRLVDVLNANMNPGAHCPGIRRVILEQSIYMMECNSHYTSCFNEFRMIEALWMVEEMPSGVENYRTFLGDAGFMEYSTPLFALVDRAKELMGRQCLQGVSRVN
ncbi:Os07g0654000 [Oryza sativa Japonica Group]|uniref:Os07g0654000 protein n=1 Tax=Oryza sativa subsp. japonica TaxID=39947 RepID=A0A0P0XA70_ORYSJ|nr:Os07g0654000 [Oryza sativa Japonica Group]